MVKWQNQAKVRSLFRADCDDCGSVVELGPQDITIIKDSSVPPLGPDQFRFSCPNPKHECGHRTNVHPLPIDKLNLMVEAGVKIEMIDMSKSLEDMIDQEAI